MALVTVFSCIERALGFIYRIFLSRSLGAETLGVYQVALSVIGLLMTITSSGIPITVSRLMAKRHAIGNKSGKYAVVTAGIFIALIISVPLILLLLIFGDNLTFLVTNLQSHKALKIMLPGVIITSVYAVIRGFFWGEKRFFTYSVIELAEEIVMLIAGVILVNASTSNLTGAEKASYAVLISYVFSFLMSSVTYFLFGGKITKCKTELKPLITSATPITLMRTLTSLLNTLIAIILPNRLIASGLTNSVAMSKYGALSGMSIPLIYIPSTLIGSIALVLVPELAENFYRKNMVTLKNNVEKAVKCAVFISTLIIPVFIALGKEIGTLIYNNLEAGEYVQKASIIMFPMSISLITTSMLNSLNLEKKTLKYYTIGAFLLLLCIWFLPNVIGIYSLVVGLMISYIITAVCNIKLISKTCIVAPKFTVFIVASLVFIVPSTLLSYLLNNVLILVIPKTLSIIITGIITVAFTYLFYKIFDLFDLTELIKSKK
ncbi:MAG: oligosaccharide flippase family protein [Clostridia bacterium]|nr:oligosaccharide flippase family protein [Clostridia bacterium]